MRCRHSLYWMNVRTFSHPFHSLQLTSDSDSHYRRGSRFFVKYCLMCHKQVLSYSPINRRLSERSWITARVFCHAFRALIAAFSGSLLIMLIKDGGIWSKWIPLLFSVIEHSVGVIELSEVHRRSGKIADRMIFFAFHLLITLIIHAR